MQYVRSISGSISGSVTKTWNSINPATLSGAIDVVVVEREDGTLACSPFHVRFGKFQLLQPFNKKVEFKVNDVKRDFPMKVGEGGEAFFVFETSDNIPRDLQTSPLVSPVTSPQAKAAGDQSGDASTDAVAELPEPEPLDLGSTDEKRKESLASLASGIERPKSAEGTIDIHSESFDAFRRPASGDWSPDPISKQGLFDPPGDQAKAPIIHEPSPNSTDAYVRAVSLSKRLWTHKIRTTVSPTGDIMLDMTGYKSNEEDSLRAEVIARRILSEEIEGNMDIGSLIGADEKGNLWIYSSEEAKAAADRKFSSLRTLNPVAMRSQDAISDPGYYSDDNPSDTEGGPKDSTKVLSHGGRRDSDSAVGLSDLGSSEGAQYSAESIAAGDGIDDPAIRNFAKTLRLTHDQLKSLDLKPGSNTMSFTVNKASCQAFIYYWRHDVPIVISDIDGTITKSDALGHVLNMIGRDWTHVGVAKLYTDIVANGYHILYLTSRSVGQADTTRGYLNGVLQDGYKLPKGPVIMSPDRTMAALRREVYLRKPEVFKMACLRDIMNLFTTTPGATTVTEYTASVAPISPTSAMMTGDTTYSHQRTPFYAGFGNRLTDALSYRSVAIPPTRIFTINSNAEVSLYLLTLNSFRASYLSIWELVDHFFPPVGMLVKEGGEDYTDFNYWRDKTLEVDQFSGSESSEEEPEEGSEEEYDDEEEEEYDEEMEGSFMSRSSMDGELEEEVVQDSILLEPVEEEDEEYEAEEEMEDVIPDDEGDQEHSSHEHPENIDAKSSDQKPDDDILITESLRIEALSLEADEEVVHSQPSLTRASTVPGRNVEWDEHEDVKEKEHE